MHDRLYAWLYIYRIRNRNSKLLANKFKTDVDIAIYDMKRWLVIPLVLLLLQRADSQNVAVGNALPCGDENLSCVNVPTTCLTVDQVCDGDNDCSPGASIDEGGTLFARLDCK